MAESAALTTIDEDARRRFEAAWRDGVSPTLESFLPPESHTWFLPTLEELVHIALEMGWAQAVKSNGAAAMAPPRLESFLERFPQLTRPDILNRLVRQEYEIRRRHGERPTPSEYVERFPELARDGQTVETWLVGDPSTLGEHLVKRSSHAPVPQIPGYENLEVLGRGGMGVVYRAKQIRLQRIVALKMIRGGDGGAEELARFQTEAEAAAHLQHPNIVQIFEIGTHDGMPFLALEYVGGGTLAQHLSGKPQPPRHAAEIVAILARAIHFAHTGGIIHRDLKPANVLLAVVRSQESGVRGRGSGSNTALTPDHCLLTPDSCIPKIADFGLAKRLGDQSGQTQTGAVVGTPAYMAPEQAAGKSKDVGPAADIYALGAILYEMLAGRPPFKGDSVLDVLEQVRSAEPSRPSRFQARIHPDVETICLKALAKETSQRYASALALAEDLERFNAGEPILARPVGRLRKLWYKVRRRRAAMVGCGLMALAGIVLAVLLWNRDQLGREKNRLLDRLDTALVKPLLTAASFDAVQADIDALRLLDAEQADRKQEHAFARIAEAVEIALQQEQLDVQRVADLDAVIGQLGTAKATAAETLRTLLNNRKSGWEPAAHLVGPFDAGPSAARAAVFEPTDVAATRTALTLAPTIKQPGAVVRTRVVTQHNAEMNVVLGPGWDAAPQVALWLNAIPGHTGAVESLSFSKNGRFLVSAAARGEVMLWEIASRRLVWTHRPTRPQALCVVHSPTVPLVAVGNSGEGAITLLDAATGAVVRRVQGTGKSVATLAFSPNGQVLAVGGGIRNQFGDVQFFDTTTWLPLEPLTGHANYVGRLAFSPDGKLLATCGRDNVVKIWDLAKRQELAAATNLRSDTVPHARFSADSKQLIGSGHLDKTKPGAFMHAMFVWDRDAGKVVREIDPGLHSGGMVAFAMAPDDRWAAFASFWNRNKVHLLDMNQRKLRTLIFDDRNRVVHGALEFSPDGVHLATGSSDGKVKLWHVADGVVRTTLEQQGYAFALRPVAVPTEASNTDATETLAGVRKRGGQVSLALLRNGTLLREQVLRAEQLPPGESSLKLLAKREGAKLLFHVGRLAPLHFHDLVPWSDFGHGTFAVECAPGAGLERLALLRRAAPAQPTPLERGDDQFARGNFGEALAAYRSPTLTTGPGELAKEAQLKAAQCLLALERREEAGQALEQLAGEPATHWGAAAGCQLMLLRLQQNRADDADALFDALSHHHRLENLQPFVSSELLRRLTNVYVKDSFGFEFVQKVKATDLRNLERARALQEYFGSAAAERSQLEFTLLRALHYTGDLDKAHTLATSILSRQPWGNRAGWEHAAAPLILQASWVLRQRGTPDAALALVNKYLEAALADKESKLAHLLIERSRIHAALGDWPQAEKDVDDYLQRTTPVLGTFPTRAAAGMIQGFLRQRRGDTAGAKASWQRGTYAAWCAEVGRREPERRFPTLGGMDGTTILYGMILAALADELPDDEADFLIQQIARRAVGDTPFALIHDRLSLPKGILRTMWQTPRGGDCASKFALLDLPFRDYAGMPLMLVTAELIRSGAMPKEMTADQEAVLWETANHLYTDYVEDKLTMPHIFALALTWKGTTNFLGWSGVAPALPQRERAAYAFCMGFRYLRLARPTDARSFFESAAKDAAGTPLERLAQVELAKLKKVP